MLCAAINQVYNRHNRGAAVENEICSALCAEVESGVIALKSDAATPIPRRATAKPKIRFRPSTTLRSPPTGPTGPRVSALNALAVTTQIRIVEQELEAKGLTLI